ncbi:hypothetical protein GGX14DRAFT_636851 [Mycena pura]|uniref:Prolyl 4-hydroxylase alpha subunit domain-containing protein n=1 Tax=Mycena pura TaxID=153505 RepID=A0AAD6VAH2_9AGAR|nr:hypothetical protein GGX14DRAFT_636851 [Mycena pura]
MKASTDRGPRPVPAGLIDFTAAGLPEYEGCYAIVLDSLLSKPELSSILEEAERQPWQVAQVNAGTRAFTNTSYRNGQRIIYDSFELSRKIFEKVRPHLSAIEEIEEPVWIPGVGDAVQKWRMVRMNERLRFLRYPKGGFFRAHVDGCYENEANGQRTFYTLQLYLPSDTSGSAESFVPATGGTTRFWGDTGREYADVEALPGRVLVFQHDTLEHTGEEVVDGVKCAMRSDILYEMVGDPIPVSAAGSA